MSDKDIVHVNSEIVVVKGQIPATWVPLYPEPYNFVNPNSLIPDAFQTGVAALEAGLHSATRIYGVSIALNFAMNTTRKMCATRDDLITAQCASNASWCW